jgi:hypothetical protein
MRGMCMFLNGEIEAGNEKLVSSRLGRGEKREGGEARIMGEGRKEGGVTVR